MSRVRNPTGATTAAPVPAPRLVQLGWADDFAAAFAALGDATLSPARVAIEHNHIYRVATEAGELLAQTAGRLRHRAGAADQLPAVGDWVAVAPDASGGQATIRAVLPRRSCFVRKAAGDPTLKQVVAANIDVVFIVTGLDDDFSPRRIERYLVAAAESGARPVVVLNKADLHDDVAACVAAVRAVAPDAPIHLTSCPTGTGIDALDVYLRPGETVALLGSSGAGKSTLINRILGEARQRTQAVRAADSRGRHTTVHRELIVRPAGGIIIDTPGMRELQIWDTERAVEDAFADVMAFAGACRFRDCGHRSEPGCGVRAAAADGRLPAARLADYHRLVDERTVLETRRAERTALGERRGPRTPPRSTRRRRA